MLLWFEKLISALSPLFERITVTLVEAIIAGGALGGLLALGAKIQIAFGLKDSEGTPRKTL